MTPAESQKALRDRRRQSGLCILCGLASRPCLTTCEGCHRKRSKATARWRESHRLGFNQSRAIVYAGRKADRLCVRCGQHVKLGTICDGCKPERLAAQKRSYVKHIASGLCVRCGKPAEKVICTSCSATAKEYNSSPKIQERSVSWRASRWREWLFATLKARAANRGIMMDPALTPEDIPDPAGRVCPVFKTPFVMGSRKKCDESATVDRIDSSRGYVPGNLQLLSSLANSIKNNATSELVRSVGRAVVLMESGVNLQFATETDKAVVQSMVKRKKVHAAKLRRGFSLTWMDIIVPSICPCLGVPLTHGSTDWRFRPSIDRLDNNLDYTPGNVWVISAWANAIKSNATGSQILRVADWMDERV